MAIYFHDVSYRYQATSKDAPNVLTSINLEIPDGQFVGIVGSTGSGKSTLIQHCNGILQPSEGSVHIYDYVIEAGKKQPLRMLRKRVGLVFQFPEQQLFEETVEKDLCFGPLNFGIAEEEAKQLAGQALQAVGLDESLLSRSPFELSGGQMRKAAIASVLAMNPDTLILDEPTATLDPQSRDELMSLLYKLCKEGGKTILIITHRLEEMLNYADQLIVMHDGKIAFDGSPSEWAKQTEPFMQSLGLVVPKSIRLKQAFEDKFHTPLSEDYGSFTPAELADQIEAYLVKQGKD
ncbi:energy-coupling factor transporter ATPase [Paenibacillus albiflavus]|uniref:Energy-coupling factor transporter ATP-binding protein EcfA2 n=1 Tax=Paenibacillus albiflavus TaxID=2545760 RepID=A0A4R4EAP9_9BACL|nr:energy-coupling factor transporter ATPase [Paenibacillus albiflavus]TCZ76357.1 energy-coupling factor transporter ATPase [Paenibacillus albiflavus]